MSEFIKVVTINHNDLFIRKYDIIHIIDKDDLEKCRIKVKNPDNSTYEWNIKGKASEIYKLLNDN